MELKQPLFECVDAVAAVVPDAADCAKLFLETYGIGPWECGVSSVTDVIRAGSPAEDYSFRRCRCLLPNDVSLEFITPLNGESDYARFLRDRGPGIHHISVSGQNDFRTVCRSMAEAGHPPAETGRILGGLRAVVPHSDIVGCALEVHEPETEIPEDVRYLPGPGKTPEKTPLFTCFDQIGIVVPDAEAAARFLWDQYGIGPWVFLTFGGGEGTVSIENVVFEGNPVAQFSARTALSVGLNIQLEIMTPLADGGIHTACLQRYGPMAQHLSVQQELPYEEIQRRMEEAGFGTGQVCTVDTTETCLYSDHMARCGFYLEAHKRPENFIPPQVPVSTWPPNLDIQL